MGLLGSTGQKLISFDQSRQPRPQRKALYLICEPGWPNYGDELIARDRARERGVRRRIACCRRQPNLTPS